MANILGVYNPIFYAQEALMLLYKNLGLAGRIHRGFDAERRSFGKGDTINIRKPGTFTAQDAPSTVQDMNTETVAVVLNRHKEVKLRITDKELAYTQTRIITDHIEPAAFALADELDQFLNTFYAQIPWEVAIAAAPGSTTVNDILGPQTVAFDNKVPIHPGRMHYEIDGKQQQGFLALPAFSQHQGAGLEGVQTQMSGSLGVKFGTEIFAAHNTPTHLTGTASVTALLVNDAAANKGDTTIGIDAASVTGILRKGDTFVIAGNTQRYAVQADVTASGNAFANVSIYPPLVQNYADNAAITLSQQGAANTSMKQMIYFHRNFACLAMAPLHEMGNELGAKVATITDPFTGLSLRSRLWYEPDASEVRVALDMLYGGTVLDGNLAVRGYRTP